MTRTLLPLPDRYFNIFWGGQDGGKKEESDPGSLWTILVFPAAELRCWRSAERTAGRDNQKRDADSVSAATRSLFTVAGESDLGASNKADRMLIFVLK